MGLPDSPRRRTPGLRREDVAELAGISAIWYTWLEQAREINVSEESLRRIAAALRLTTSETKHLFALADKPFALPKSETAAEIPAALYTVLNGFSAMPAFIIGRYLDVRAWNEAAEKLFGEFLRDPKYDKNWVRFVFERENRDFFANWEDFARCTLAVLRNDYGRYADIGDAGARLVGDLENEFPEFREWWQTHDVLDRPHSRKEFQHPQAGLLIFDSVTLSIEDATELKIVIYAPSEIGETKKKLTKLLNR